VGLTSSPTSAFDLLEALDDMGGRARITRWRFGLMARQVSEGCARTWRDADGALVCVVGLWPAGDHLEAWLAVGPSFRANLRPARRAVLAALDIMTAELGAVEVRAYVKPGDRVAGARMARWWGLESTGTEATPIGPVEVFSRRFQSRHDKPG
jgi:hypothetical protein